MILSSGIGRKKTIPFSEDLGKVVSSLEKLNIFFVLKKFSTIVRMINSIYTYIFFFLQKLHEYNQADLGAEMEVLATGNPSNMWMFTVKDLSG